MQQAIVFQEIGYIGKKAVKRDTVFGTRLIFTQGQTHPVPSNIANQMVQHADVYVLAESEQFKTYLAALNAGNVKVENPSSVTTELTETQKINEKVKQLEIELSKLVRKEQIREHVVVARLNIEFSDDDKLSQMVEKSVSEYRQYLVNKLVNGAE